MPCSRWSRIHIAPRQCVPKESSKRKLARCTPEQDSAPGGASAAFMEDGTTTDAASISDRSVAALQGCDCVTFMLSSDRGRSGAANEYAFRSPQRWRCI